MNAAPRLAVALLVVTAAVLGVAVASIPTTASHGEEANYTVIPEDRQPGMDDATYTQFAISPRYVDYLDYIAATWHAGGFTGCGPGNTEVFGLDRGNDNDGREVDEDLRDYVEESHVGEDHFRADFYEKDDAVGSSTHMDEGDQFVGYVKNCFDNPDEPGWYQINSSVGGWTEDDEYIQRNTTSHYFAICDCEDEQEARQKLGPPPSEQGGGDGGGGSNGGGSNGDGSGDDGSGSDADGGSGGGTASSTADSTSGSGGEGEDGGGTDGNSSSDGDASGTGTNAGTPTPTDGGVDGAAGGNGQDPGGGEDNWDDHLRKTPTPGAGPGFGPLGAITALMAAAFLAVRRTL